MIAPIEINRVTVKGGAGNSALLVETCEQSPCRKQPQSLLLGLILGT